MKTTGQKNLMTILVIVMIAVMGYSGKQISDKVIKYQSYKSLKSITDLAIPIHSSIESLQKERYLSGTYLQDKNPAILEAFLKIHSETDKQLKKFAEQLKKTQLLLLSIPESELEETTKSLFAQRANIANANADYKENKDFYSYILSDFLNFLDKMYEFANDPEYQPVVETLIAAEFYKESLAQEIMDVTSVISRPAISAGEIPLLRQMINDQMFTYEKLYKAKDPEIQRSLQLISASDEKAKFFELRQKFEKLDPDLTGSPERARDYYEKGTAYKSRFSKVNEQIFKRLEKLAKEGLEVLKEEITRASLMTLAAIIILAAIAILIQRIKTER